MSGITKLYRRDNQPFAQIPNSAIRNPRLTPNAFRLLAYLMSHQDGYDLTYGQIERETALGRFAINGAIQILTKEGWLKVETTKMPNGQFGPKAWTVYDPTSATVGNSTAVDSTVEQPTDNKKTTIREEHLEKKYPQDKLEEEFSEFWKHYPRKVEKLAAQRAFRKALEVTTSQEILQGVIRLANDPNLPPKQFIPHPATWLNGGGWENEPYPERVLSAEEAKQKAEAERLARRERERELVKAEQARLRLEEEEARQRAEAVKKCQHGRVAVICPKCVVTKLQHDTDTTQHQNPDSH